MKKVSLLVFAVLVLSVSIRQAQGFHLGDKIRNQSLTDQQSFI